MTGRLKNIVKIPALNVAMWLFLAIPMILMCAVFGISDAGMSERVFENPVFVIQFVTALTYIFNYLMLKSMVERMGHGRESWLLPLWLLALGQALTLNLFTTGLVACGIYQEYGKDAINPQMLRADRKNRSLVGAAILVGLLYLFLLAARKRTGI